MFLFFVVSDDNIMLTRRGAFLLVLDVGDLTKAHMSTSTCTLGEHGHLLSVTLKESVKILTVVIALRRDSVYTWCQLSAKEAKDNLETRGKNERQSEQRMQALAKLS